MAIPRDEQTFAKTVVDFSCDGLFPEEDNISAILVQSSALPVALNALASAKGDLESEIRKISTESAPEVDSWISHAKAIQEDIERSRNLASEVVRLAEASESTHASLKNSDERLEFLSKEATYCKQVGDALRGIKNVRDLLDEVEEAAVERRILPALHVLSDAWDIIYKIPTSGRTRAIRLLDDRAFALRASIHENFNAAWDAIVHVDVDEGCITIKDELEEVDAINISDAIITMKAYGELDERVNNFSRSLEDIIIRPRFDLKGGVLASINIIGNTLRTSSTPADHTIKSLLDDLEKTIEFLNKHLPSDFSRPLSEILMPKLCYQIKETWLDSAVPTSLQNMTAFRKAISLVQTFANNLNTLQWTGGDELLNWVTNAPRIWLTKRRETALDWTRNQLSLGIGTTRKVDRVETQMLSHSEGRHISTTGNGNGNDWDAAWSDDEQDNSLEQEKYKSTTNLPNTTLDSLQESNTINYHQDDDATDAWGWGDDEVGDIINKPDDEKVAPGDAESPADDRLADTVREVTLTEKYTISSMPDPVYNTIKTIIEDGTTLSREINEQNPVAAAAAGLFALPTLVLAMYRAVSPYYYCLSPGGNMYLYNDALWLAEQLQDFNKKWALREDLGPRVSGKVRLENEVEMLQNFGKRAYGIEMTTQRVILNDLLGGAQNFLLQDGQNPAEDEAAIDSIVSHIRTVSAQWKQILSKSAWAQATGSLLSTIAKKVILDVDELSSLGADEAYRVANLISKIVVLDELFVPENEDLPQIPVTSQYAPYWLKLHFLSEVLQSDLKDVKYLWFESDLSLYFTAKEVVDLIELSFENNSRTREAITSITENPEPRGVSAEDL